MGSVVKPVKAISVVAALLGLVGAGLVLAALLGVQNAPVYQSVGQDSEQYDVVYVSGVTALYGLITVALGAVSAVGFVASIFLCNATDGNILDNKDLKPA